MEITLLLSALFRVPFLVIVWGCHKGILRWQILSSDVTRDLFISKGRIRVQVSYGLDAFDTACWRYRCFHFFCLTWYFKCVILLVNCVNSPFVPVFSHKRAIWQWGVSFVRSLSQRWFILTRCLHRWLVCIRLQVLRLVFLF